MKRCTLSREGWWPALVGAAQDWVPWGRGRWLGPGWPSPRPQPASVLPQPPPHPWASSYPPCYPHLPRCSSPHRLLLLSPPVWCFRIPHLPLRASSLPLHHFQSCSIPRLPQLKRNSIFFKYISTNTNMVPQGGLETLNPKWYNWLT
jgi:hypothetical protein